jgi:hypothetical protein
MILHNYIKSGIPSKVDIFLLSFLIFVVCISIGPVRTPNERSHFAVVFSIVEYGTLHISHYDPIDLPSYAYVDISFYGGKYYSALAPGMSFLAIPSFVIGRVFLEPTNVWIMQAVVTVTSALFAALSVTLAYEMSVLLGAKKWAAVLSSLAYAFGTPLWNYAETLFAHATSAFLIALGYYLILRVADSQNTKLNWLIISGLILGFAGFVEYPNLLLLAPACLYLLDRLPKVRSPIYFGASAFVGALPTFIYNYLSFESPMSFPLRYFIGYPFATSYRLFDNPLYAGLDGLLLSPFRGLFYYSPILLLSLPGFAIIYQRQRCKAILLASSFLLPLIFYSSYQIWHGGLCYGPRYLVGIIFLLIPLLALTIDRYSKSKAFVVVFSLFLGYSLLTSASAALTKFWIYWGYEKFAFLEYGLPLFLSGKFDCWILNSPYYAYPIVLIYVGYITLRVRNRMAGWIERLRTYIVD